MFIQCTFNIGLWVNITLNCHVVGFDIGYHEAIITVMNTSLDFNYSGTNQICH